MLPFALKGLSLDGASGSRAFVDFSGDSEMDCESEWEPESKESASLDPELGRCVLRLRPAWRKRVEDSETHHLDTANLVVALGNTACAFIESHVLGEVPGERKSDSGQTGTPVQVELVGALFSGLPTSSEHNLDHSALGGGSAGLLFYGNSFSQRHSGDANCFLYILREGSSESLLCLCRNPVRPAQWHHWSQCLLELVDPGTNYVAIFTTESVTRYLQTEVAPMGPPFLRALKTRLFRGTPACPYLEQPNLMSGLAAQLLSHCQMRDLPAVLYVAYSASAARPWQALDVSAVRLMSDTLRCTPLKDLQSRWPKNTEDVLKRLIRAVNATCAVGEEAAVYYPTAYG